ncbi:Hypothetical predicted protein [Podarcis lilfordi]|uniref:Uncharacterized protein n=1 Tax=Podarcis lilfordi TaxID=74358 RepID=A0AA35L0V9_9SAUR|nr:Hypothetical predicted protein [Podarcis lilfordi]
MMDEESLCGSLSTEILSLTHSTFFTALLLEIIVKGNSLIIHDTHLSMENGLVDKALAG